MLNAMVFRTMRGCPICGGGFNIRRVREYSYETCADCHGVWMSRGTLAGMGKEIAPEAQLSMRAEQINETTRACPDCQRAMKKAWMFRVPLDFCSAEQHGIWFDGGELRQVLERIGQEDPPPAEIPTSFRSLLADFFNQS